MAKELWIAAVIVFCVCIAASRAFAETKEGATAVTENSVQDSVGKTMKGTEESAGTLSAPKVSVQKKRKAYRYKNSAESRSPRKDWKFKDGRKKAEAAQVTGEE